MTRCVLVLAYLIVMALLAGGCYVPTLQVTVTPADGTPMESGMLDIQLLILGREKPLRNVQVEIYAGQFEPIPGALIDTVVTDNDGIARFELSPGSYGVWVRALDMDAQWRFPGPTQMSFSRSQQVILEMIPAP